MKHEKKFIFLVLAAFTIASAQQPHSRKIVDFKAKDLTGRTVSYSEIKGERYTVIDFWATWCRPCIQAIPRLVELYDQYRGCGVQFIGLDVDGYRNVAKVKPMVSFLKISYPVLIDPDGTLMTKLKVIAVPTLLIVNAEDEVVYAHRGYQKGDNHILAEEFKERFTEPQDSSHAR